MSNFATVLVETAGRHPQRLAVQGEDRTLTCAELDELSARAAGGLLAHGVRPGDRVGLRLPYSAAFAVLCFGALRAGAIAMPLCPGPRTRLLGVRPRHDAHGARTVFASADTTAQEIRPSDTALVQVGDDFLDQVMFWPLHTDVVHRADHAPAVAFRFDDGPGTGDRTLSHRALRETALATELSIGETDTEAHHASASAVFLGGRHHGMEAVILVGACLRVTEERARTVSRGGHGEPTVLRPAPGPRSRR
ncbi:AMP-binding protein [Streptomyces rochei]|uniref:AMP-binding protein n=1 Tax=Streptomyces rochei TaxID=1928 RepID=UPI003411F032